MLNDHEKEVLRCLARDARTTDSAIAKGMKISTQAVGRIRRKLEQEEVIKFYAPRFDSSKIGLKVFTVAALTLPPELLKDETRMRKRFTDDPHVTNCYQLLHGGASLFVVFVFKSLEESEAYFKAFRQEFPNIGFVNLQAGTWDLVWKSTKRDAYLYALDDGKGKKAVKKKR